jgi:hypothetical protein
MGRKARQAMDKEQKRAAKAHFVAQIQAGQPWYVAAARAGLPISRSTAYRLLQVYASQGEAALRDGRHGHSSKGYDTDVSTLSRGQNQPFFDQQSGAKTKNHAS